MIDALVSNITEPDDVRVIVEVTGTAICGFDLYLQRCTIHYGIVFSGKTNRADIVGYLVT